LDLIDRSYIAGWLLVFSIFERLGGDNTGSIVAVVYVLIV
jgi:hypothetical protein